MATQHSSIWRNEYDDMSLTYVPYNPSAISTSGGSLVIDMSKSNSSVFEYERINSNSDIAQTTTNYSAAYIYGGNGSVGSGQTSQSIIQSFTAVSTNIYAVGLYFNVRTGTSTDGVTVSIRDSPNGGAALGSKTIPASSITNGSEVIFIFGNVPLTLGDTYYIEISRTGARDTVNYFGIEYNGSSTYTVGGLYRRDEGAVVSVGSTADARFLVYGIDTFDMSGGKEFFWEIDAANSTITPNKVAVSMTIDLFDKDAGTRSRTISPNIIISSTDVYWRTTFSSSNVLLLSSPNNSTWSTRWTGPALSVSAVKSVYMRRTFFTTSATADMLRIKYFSLGTQQPIPTRGVKVWDGTAWNAKPVKYWNGVAWVQKPVKRWNGSQWITPSY